MEKIIETNKEEKDLNDHIVNMTSDLFDTIAILKMLIEYSENWENGVIPSEGDAKDAFGNIARISDMALEKVQAVKTDLESIESLWIEARKG